MEKDHKQLWADFLAVIRDIVSPEQYESWFKPITSLSFKDGRLDVCVPSPFFMEHLEANYIKLITPALRRIYGAGVQMFYAFEQVKDEPSTKVTMGGAMPSTAIPMGAAAATVINAVGVDGVVVDSHLNPRYTFENYCGSKSNQIARAMGEAIANDPHRTPFNPLFVFGPTGVGKTHLIQAIGIRIKERDPQANVLYITARYFESEFTTAARDNRINDFIRFYQKVDVLIIDDIQDFIGKKPATQNAFFHIFNHLHQNSKQIIMSSDVCPSRMEGMEERLLSRFRWGVTVELESPDLELRRNVLTMKARQDGLELAPEVMDFIATNVTHSIRELEGVVVSILAHATVLNQDVTLDLARNVLANAVKVNRRAINFEMVAQEVCSYYNVDIDLIYTSLRKREVSDARQMVMYLAKKLVKMPLTAIGTRLSRGHATVLHGCKNIEERLSVEKSLREDMEAIEKRLV